MNCIYLVFVLLMHRDFGIWNMEIKPEESNPTNPFVGAFCFPHGAITLDPQTRNFSGIPAVKADSKEKCISLHNAMLEQARVLVSTKPELIILSTPHGLRTQNNYLFLANNNVREVRGSVTWDGDWSNFTANFSIESDLSKLIVSKLTEKRNPVELLSLGSKDDPLPLRWAEVIPWWFIVQAASKTSFKLPPVIFIGQPAKRSQGTAAMIPELLKLGNDLTTIILSEETLKSKRIAIVISSDLSHYHSADPTSPYPYNPLSVVFDGFIEQWVTVDMTNETEKESTQLLTKKAGGIADQIGTCGYTGLVTVQGMLQGMVQKGFEFKANFLDYSAPTYFGMMVNYWLAK